MGILDKLRLSSEGNVPSLDGATEWLNSEPLTAADLRGHVVAFDFWTFTCINWIRTAPYRRAWYEKYREQGLILIGVHTPEFPFEQDVDSIRAHVEEMRIEYPVAVDSDYAIWTAFANNYWPALYVADTEGAIRFHRYGEEGYEESSEPSRGSSTCPAPTRLSSRRKESKHPPTGRRCNLPRPTSAPSGASASPRRAAQPGRSPGATRTLPAHLNRWALSGEWTLGRKAAHLNEAGGSLAYRFRARDVNLVMGPPHRRQPVRFQVRIDGGAPGDASGVDVDERGEGTAHDRRLYQLVRQPREVGEHTFEITFLEPGIEAYVFTFG